MDLGGQQGILLRFDSNTPQPMPIREAYWISPWVAISTCRNPGLPNENGANIFIHGLDVNRLDGKAVVFDGATQVATTGTLNTMAFQGQTVLAVGGQPVHRSDGSPIVV